MGGEIEGFSFRFNVRQQHCTRSYERKCNVSEELDARDATLDTGNYFSFNLRMNTGRFVSDVHTVVHRFAVFLKQISFLQNQFWGLLSRLIYQSFNFSDQQIW